MIIPRRLSSLQVSAIAMVVAILSGCESPITDVTPDLAPQFTTTSTTGRLALAKRGPAGTTATFEISATGGTLPHGTTITLDACSESPCPTTVVWFGDTTEEVTITEVDFTGNLVLERIRVISKLNGTVTNYFWPEDPTVTTAVEPGDWVSVSFKNVGEPPVGIAGCTPGFWKQSQHFQYWTDPYTTATPFGDVFEDAFPSMTLLEVLGEGGGGLTALGRHTVAALLNAASPNVDYGMNPDQVIAAFNAAYLSHDYEDQKDIFESYNERGCTAKVK